MATTGLWLQADSGKKGDKSPHEELCRIAMIPGNLSALWDH